MLGKIIKVEEFFDGVDFQDEVVFGYFDYDKEEFVETNYEEAKGKILQFVYIKDKKICIEYRND